MIIVAGKIYVDPQARDAYLAGCRDIIDKARVAAGCFDFHLTPDPIEAGRINVFERWDSDADVARFRGKGPDTGQVTKILGAEVHKYRISSVEQP